MKKFLVFLLLIMFSCFNLADAKSTKRDFNSIINESGVEKNSISVSIKDLNTGKVVYQLNEKILMHPASIQKVLTLPPAIEVLGEDYKFSTEIYKRDDNTFLFKLGADPYLTTSDLSKLASKLTLDTKKVLIDDSILEKKDWGEGWQWDDDMNILMPRFNSYNLDRNLIKLTIMPTNKGELATIINPSKYPLVFLNNVITSDKNDVKVTRDNSISNNALALNGTVNKPVTVYVPTNNLKRYFDIRLMNTLADKKIYLKQNFIVDKKISSDVELEKITHPISQAIDDILKNSDNLVAETTVKLAGGKKYEDKGTDINGIKVFNSYCEKMGLDNSRLKIVDGSGVSKNNLITTDFMTEFLIKNKDNSVLAKLPSPGEGTLTHRMLPIKENLKAKTGTLADISSIAGFLTTKNNNKYAFCIIINDPSSTTSDMKSLEDYLIRELYLKL